jgi:hypothetical protein
LRRPTNKPREPAAFTMALSFVGAYSRRNTSIYRATNWSKSKWAIPWHIGAITPRSIGASISATTGSHRWKLYPVRRSSGSPPHLTRRRSMCPQSGWWRGGERRARASERAAQLSVDFAPRLTS